MISSLSPFIQLFAAIYLTMCLDNLFIRRFWSQKYNVKINNALDSINMPVEARKPTIRRAKKINEVEELRMRKRGTFMFIMAVFLLILIGFEEDLANVAGCITLSYSYCFLTYMVIVFYLLDESIMSHWLKEYFLTLILIVVFFVLLFALSHLGIYMYDSKDEGVMRIARIMVVLVLSIPVVWQLFRSWLYAKYYLSYVLSEVKVKAGNTNNSEKATPVEITGGEAFAAKNDAPVNPDIDTYMEKLSKIDFFPSFWPLLDKSWKSFWYSNPLPHKCKRLYWACAGLGSVEEKKEYCEKNHTSYKSVMDYFKKKKAEEKRRQFINRITIWVAVLTALIVAGFASFFWRVGYDSIIFFIGKWVLRWFVAIGVLELFAYLIGQEIWRRREQRKKQGSD